MTKRPPAAPAWSRLPTAPVELMLHPLSPLQPEPETCPIHLLPFSCATPSTNLRREFEHSADHGTQADKQVTANT